MGTGMENRNILVIEDNELNMKLMRGIFSIGKYHIIEAFDAETGIRLARKHKPFLVLMDIQLPGMDGLKATRIMKADPQLKDIPVVALTGFAMQGDEEKARKSGCEGYITKPIDIQEVLETIDGFHRKAIPTYNQDTVAK
jgi:CheY-like chemotaxis protein